MSINTFVDDPPRYDSPLLQKFGSAVARNYDTGAGVSTAKDLKDSGNRIERFEAWLTDHGLQTTMIVMLVFANLVVFLRGAAVGYVATATNPDYWLKPIGRGFGEVLNLNCALVIFPVCHALWFMVQGTRLSMIFPSERLMTMHKAFAYLIAVATVPHGIVGIKIYANSLEAGYYPFGFDGFGGLQMVFWTGIIGVVLYLLIYVTSRACVRRGKHFELFWWAHHGFVLFEICIFLHGFQFGVLEYWKYFLGPAIVYLIDRFYRTCSAGGAGIRCSVIKAECFSGSLNIYLSKPQGFTFRSGMYATLQCGAVSRSEWHAFTIVSSPADDHLMFCIKVTGDWTLGLYTLVKPGVTEEMTLRVRGPFGAPSAFAHQFEHITLVGGGIGATPFVSVLRDICDEIYTPEIPKPTRRGQTSYAHTRTDSVILNKSLQRALEEQENDARRAGLAYSWDAGLVSVNNNGQAVQVEESSSPDDAAVVVAAENIYKSRASRLSQRHQLYVSRGNLYASRSSALMTPKYNTHTVSRVLRLYGTRKSVVAQTPEELVEPPTRSVAIAARLTAVVHSLLVQLPILWLFMAMVTILASQYVFVEPIWHIFPVYLSYVRISVSTLLCAVVAAGFIADVICAPKQFLSQRNHWIEVLLLFAPLLTILIVDMLDMGNESNQLHLLIVWMCIISITIGFVFRFYILVGSRLYYQPLEATQRAKLQTVNFIWTCTTVQEMEWLVPELVALEARDSRNLLDIRLYVTRETGDLPNLGLRHGLQKGRPDWMYELTMAGKALASGSVMGVFFCGPASMGQGVRAAAAAATAASMEFDEEKMAIRSRSRFIFFKEVF